MSDTIYIFNEKLKASERRRFVSCIIDFFFVFVTLFISGLVIVIIGNVFNWDIFSVWERIFLYNTSLTFLSILLFNFLLLEWLFGRSPGKFFMRTIVVNQNGLKPGFSSVFIRTLCRLIPFDVFSFLGKSGRFWHDSISKTYVVEKSKLDFDIKVFYGVEKIGIKDID